LTAFVCVTAIIVLVGFFLVLLAWAKQWSIAAAERERAANEAKQVILFRREVSKQIHEHAVV
jgi:hypothetical protein